MKINMKKIYAYPFLLLLGCGAGTPTPAQQETVAIDAAEQKKCVDDHSTKEAIDKCRDAVKAKRDGGAS